MEKQRVFKLVITENYDKNVSSNPLLKNPRLIEGENIISMVGLVSESLLNRADGIMVGGFKEFASDHLSIEQITEAIAELLPQAIKEAEEWEEKHG